MIRGMTVDDLRHRSHASDRSGGRPSGPAAEPPFGSPPYGVPPSGARAAPYLYGPLPFVPPQRTARFGSPYPRTAPYPAPCSAPAAPPGVPPRGGRGLPIAVIAGITALVLAGVVTLVVLICHAAPRAAPGTSGERQMVTTRVDDDHASSFDTDTRAQGDAVFAASRFRPAGHPDRPLTRRASADGS